MSGPSLELRGTYRVQLRPEFGFDAAAGVVEYLAALGVSHLYCSPYLQAAPASSHGYDIVDYGWINEELGGSIALARLDATLNEHSMGQVLDIVPNHMATGPENAWWWDVLCNGPASRYAGYFDIDWHGPESRLRGKVLLPILGSHYGRVLEAGSITLVRGGAAFQIHCPGHVLPVTPESLSLLLMVAAARSGSRELESIAAALGRLPLGTNPDPEAVRERERDGDVLLGSLARLMDERPEVASAVDETVGLVNADPDTLDVLLEAQNYRLAFWRTAGRDLPYRRFFDINTLVGLNMEREDVFEATHALVLQRVSEGLLDGLRVDHPDGLRDPENYLHRLRAAAGGCWVVVEKILQPGERLHPSWPVQGTTGYDFLNRVNGLFVDPAGEVPMTHLYSLLTGGDQAFQEIALASKRQVMSTVLASDINRLTESLVQICESHRRYRDYTRHELHEALQEFMASLPVYRTNVDADNGRIVPEDRATIRSAAKEAQGRRGDLDSELFQFLNRLLTLELTGPIERELVMRLQQISAAVMAKGVEDTAFYRYNRFVSLNEVGGAPDRFGVAPEEFHAANAETARLWPRAMQTLSTHDTKRGADVRARLNLLSEIPGRWATAVQRWMEMNDRYVSDPWPDVNIRYLSYQTLVGAWPLEPERALAYLQKASKEAKEHTSWTDPNPLYDAALADFITGVTSDDAFQEDLRRFVEPLLGPGRVNALAQALLLLTSPGVPDLYQGTELWDLSLVDPDNRRPVDFELRADMLRQLQEMRPQDLWSEAASGLPKLAVIRAAHAVRRRLPESFGPSGSYGALRAAGPHADRVVAFHRSGLVVAAVPRLVMGLIGGDQGWGLAPGPARETALALPPGSFRDEISGREFAGEVPLGDLWSVLPVALLTRFDS